MPGNFYRGSRSSLRRWLISRQFGLRMLPLAFKPEYKTRELPTTQTLVAHITSVNNLLQLFFKMPEPVAFQRRFTRTIHDLSLLRQPGVLRCPFAAPEFVRVLRGRMIAMPVRTVGHRAVVPKKQDAFCAELEGQFNRSKPAVVLPIFFMPVQPVLSHCLARTAPALRP